MKNKHIHDEDCGVYYKDNLVLSFYCALPFRNFLATDLFLNYYKMLTLNFIAPTISTKSKNKISFYNFFKHCKNFVAFRKLISKKNNIYLNPSFNSTQLDELFDIIYNINDIPNTEQNSANFDIIDFFVEKDEARINLIDKKFMELEKIYSDFNINVRVCALLKYIEHRSNFSQNLYKYGKISHKRPENGFNYGIVQITDFIKDRSDLLEFINVLQFINLFFKYIRKIIIKGNFATTSDQVKLLEKLRIFNNLVTPGIEYEKDYQRDDEEDLHPMQKYSLLHFIKQCENIHIQFADYDNDILRVWFTDIEEYFYNICQELDLSILKLKKIYWFYSDFTKNSTQLYIIPFYIRFYYNIIRKYQIYYAYFKAVCF